MLVMLKTEENPLYKLMNESHWGDATSWMSNNIATPPPAAHCWSQHVLVKQFTVYNLRVASQNKQQKFTLTPNMQVCNVINSPYWIKLNQIYNQEAHPLQVDHPLVCRQPLARKHNPTT